jgi:hypothetical protein
MGLKTEPLTIKTQGISTGTNAHSHSILFYPISQFFEPTSVAIHFIHLRWPCCQKESLHKFWAENEWAARKAANCVGESIIQHITEFFKQ